MRQDEAETLSTFQQITHSAFRNHNFDFQSSGIFLCIIFKLPFSFSCGWV